MGRELVLFTDLDGTFLDHHTYEPGPARPALQRLIAAGVTVFFCSAKTLAEQADLADRLGVDVGFIAENGGVLRLPSSEETSILGETYENIRGVLTRVRDTLGIEVWGYGDCTPEEIAAVTGLDLDAAGLAGRRLCSETLVDVDEDELAVIRQSIESAGLLMQRGVRFWSIQGQHDKGTTIQIALGKLGPRRPRITYGIGDAENDRGMFQVVDRPMLVRSHNGSWAPFHLAEMQLLDGIGPEGWVLAAESILAELD